MRLELILTGAELLDGRWSDTNTQLLALALKEIGLIFDRATVVGDGFDDIAAALREAWERADVVVVTGGLGPTVDDRTRDAAAAVFDVPLVEDAPTLALLVEFFKRFGRELSDNNRRQAQFPQGATILANPIGTAAGFAFAAGGRHALFAPGVPRELEMMAREQIVPYLKRHLPSHHAVASVSLRTFGWAEGALDKRLALIELGDVDLAFTAMTPEIMVTLTARDAEPEAAKAKLAAARALIEPAIGPAVITDDGRTLEEVVAGLLLAKNLTLATAESCTGGLIAARCTNVPGSSAWFREGAVTYSNEAKVRQLGVPAELIAAHGAVSREVAEAMAAGLRERSGADLAIAVTGIAGPSGGTLEKPVGLVHMALAGPSDVQAWRDVFSGDRRRVRLVAAEQALDRLRRVLSS
ncbi:MAG: competence/damage-inducible protein A [Myxococcales bacterium]|nr:competence/damage-inducible protein A [Myxococcales bacterium]